MQRPIVSGSETQGQILERAVTSHERERAIRLVAFMMCEIGPRIEFDLLDVDLETIGTVNVRNFWDEIERAGIPATVRMRCLDHPEISPKLFGAHGRAPIHHDAARQAREQAACLGMLQKIGRLPDDGPDRPIPNGDVIISAGRGELKSELLPNKATMLTHIEALVSPARDKFSDALVEIAWGKTDRPKLNSKGETTFESGPNRAKLFPIDPESLDAAAEWAATQNQEDGVNVYVGGVLKKPSTKRNDRTNTSDAYVATSLFVDIDRDAVITAAQLNSICASHAVVTTGQTPQLRQQRWAKLDAPCDNLVLFKKVNDKLVDTVQSDKNAKGLARLCGLPAQSLILRKTSENRGM